MAGITEQMLYCIRSNQIFPQHIQLTDSRWVIFYPYGVELREYCIKYTCSKFINNYDGLSADQLNQQFVAMEWVKY